MARGLPKLGAPAGPGFVPVGAAASSTRALAVTTAAGISGCGAGVAVDVAGGGAVALTDCAGPALFDAAPPTNFTAATAPPTPTSPRTPIAIGHAADLFFCTGAGVALGTPAPLATPAVVDIPLPRALAAEYGVAISSVLSTVAVKGANCGAAYSVACIVGASAADTGPALGARATGPLAAVSANAAGSMLGRDPRDPGIRAPNVVTYASSSAISISRAPPHRLALSNASALSTTAPIAGATCTTLPSARAGRLPA